MFYFRDISSSSSRSNADFLSMKAMVEADDGDDDDEQAATRKSNRGRIPKKKSNY
jgi:hypothetical protein